MAAQPSEQSTATALVTAATAAPSMHNAQPWAFRFHIATRTFEVRADPERTMPRTDPDHRALHLGCGAALFNLRAAAAHNDFHTRTKVLPDPADPDLLATVRLDSAAGPDPDLAALFGAIHERHTSRQPFSDKEIPADLQALLKEAARQEGAQLLFADEWHAETVLSLVQDAEGRDTLDPDRFEDMERWTRPGSDSPGTGPAGDGIPEYAFGPRKRAGKAPVRDFAGRRPVADRGSDTFEDIPHLALLGTHDDRPANWLRAGQAMERVLLLATGHGLATSLTSHALEWPDLRQLVRDPLSAMGHVHMVLRLGYGPSGPGTPRRPVHEVLEVD